MLEQSVTIRPLSGYGLATVMARKGVDLMPIAAAFGLEAQPGPVVAVNGARKLIGTGPGIWLLMEETVGPGWAAKITQLLAGISSVTDQSSGYALFEVAGPAARALLQSGLSIDMNPSAFPEGRAATSVIEHIGVILWCVGPEIFHLATFRSYATDFHRWLAAAAKANARSSRGV